MHRVDAHPPVEQAELARHRVGEGELRRGRKPLDALAALEDGGPGKADEDRLGEMRVADHELALGKRGELDLGRGRERRVGGRRQLVHVHATEHAGARVADDAALHLRAELLGREQHQTEVSAALGEIEQHLPHVGLGAFGRARTC